MEIKETVIFSGGAVKALGDGRIGGHLVLFGDEGALDLDDDFFDGVTDYGPHKTSTVYYHHGIDPVLGKRIIDELAPMKTDDLGVWIETQLDMQDAYERFLYERAQAGKLGWSSGTASHLIERERSGKGWHITRWPLGIDASLTLTPCDPRNRAIPLKSAKFEATDWPIQSDDSAEANTTTRALMPEDDDRASAESVRGQGKAKAMLLELELSMMEG